jgi:hypothetical protein
MQSLTGGAVLQYLSPECRLPQFQGIKVAMPIGENMFDGIMDSVELIFRSDLAEYVASYSPSTLLWPRDEKLRLRPFQSSDAQEGSAADGLVREFVKPPLYQIEPIENAGRQRWMRASVCGQPVLQLQIFVSSTSIDESTGSRLGRELAIRPPQESQEFMMTLSRHAFSHERTFDPPRTGPASGCARF